MMDKVILENPRPVNIYTLSDPETGEIRYVGKTVCTLKKRLRDHINLSQKNEYYSARWIRSLVSKNLEPIMRLIEICDENNWEEREKYHIAEMRKTCDLTNVLDGGIGLPEKHKRKLYDLREEYFKTIRKPVCQYDWQGKFIKTWEGCNIASRALGMSTSCMSRACLNKKCFFGGFYWRYFSETQGKDIKVVLSREFKNVTKMDENYKILKYYRTMKDAAIEIQSSSTAITYAIRHNTCLRGFRWAYTTHEQTT